MKAKLEFDLPEDQDDFTMAVKGPEYYFTLWDLNQQCKNPFRYGRTYKGFAISNNGRQNS